MKVLILIRSLNIGGAERQVVNLSKGLRGKGHEVLVITFYRGGVLDSELREANIPLYDLGKRHRWDITRFFQSLRKIVKRERPDIFYGYLGSANIIIALLKPLFPSIHTVWGIRASNMDLSRYDWFVRLEYGLANRFSALSDLIIVNSFSGLEYAVSRGLPRDRMIVIHNGIDTERFRPDPETKKLLRNDWNVGDKVPLIGLTARLDPMKDHETFLQAAAILVRERSDVKFVCVGDGPREYWQRLKRLSKNLNLNSHLIWAGLRRDMPRVFNALDLACSSSAYGEGFSNAIGEAMACGVPCVVTDVGDSSRIVGDSGEVVPPGEPEALAEGLNTMVQRIEKNGTVLRKRARDRIVMEFSVENMVSKSEDALLQLLN